VSDDTTPDTSRIDATSHRILVFLAARAAEPTTRMIGHNCIAAPIVPAYDRAQARLNTLHRRGLVERSAGRPARWRITADGRRVVVAMRRDWGAS